jgi:hypothetical protein
MQQLILGISTDIKWVIEPYYPTLWMVTYGPHYDHNLDHKSRECFLSYTLGATTFSITTLHIKTFSIMTLNITKNKLRRSA